jgi:two-component system, NarL family, response regulator LiaR
MQPNPDQQLRILIVEDDAMMQVGLNHTLSKQLDLKIVGMAEDGYSAIDQAIDLQPDLILMDIGLPHLDGIAATQQIKAQLPQIKVVMLTSHTHETEVIAALSSGAEGYCVKGLSIDRLLNAINAVRVGDRYLDAQIAQQVINQLQSDRKPFEANHPTIPSGTLSVRELEVLKLIVEGYHNPDIAQALHLSEHTVKTHVKSILNKLTVNDRVQAAVLALRSGLIS